MSNTSVLAHCASSWHSGHYRVRCEFLVQFGNSQVQRGVTETTRLVSQRTRQPGLARTRGADDHGVVALTNPGAGEKLADESAIQAACRSVVDVFGHRVGELEFRTAQPRRSLPGFAHAGLPFDEKPRPLFETKRLDVGESLLLGKRVGRAVQAHLVQFVNGWVFQHSASSVVVVGPAHWRAQAAGRAVPQPAMAAGPVRSSASSR